MPGGQKKSEPHTTVKTAALRRCGERMAGFTLLDMIVAISIIMILMSVAVPIYSQSILRARESVLRSDLETMRRLIQQYTLDKQKPPQSLDDLKTAGYLDQIPVDPMTRETNWEVEQDEIIMSVEQQETGITGVHSASNALSSSGDAYSSW